MLAVADVFDEVVFVVPLVEVVLFVELFAVEGTVEVPEVLVDPDETLVERELVLLSVGVECVDAEVLLVLVLEDALVLEVGVEMLLGECVDEVSVVTVK